jgi:hypothetical protein
LVNVFGGAVIAIFSFMSVLFLYVILRYFNLHRVSDREEKIGIMKIKKGSIIFLKMSVMIDIAY